MQVDEEGQSATERNLKTLHKILTGEPTINLYLEFLYRNNHSDLGVLKAIKGAFEPRNSVLHTATVRTCKKLVFFWTSKIFHFFDFFAIFFLTFRLYFLLFSFFFFNFPEF